MDKQIIGRQKDRLTDLDRYMDRHMELPAIKKSWQLALNEFGDRKF